MTAGGHWNPGMHEHGRPSTTAHMGDLGNLTVAENGSGTLTVSNPAWAFGTGAANHIVGKAVIVHAAVDDFTPMNNGNAGGRIGCAVLAKP